MRNTIKIIYHYISVGITFIKLSIQSGLEYPVNLIGWIVANPIQFIMGFATIKFVVLKFGDLNGWSADQLAFLYGIAVLSHGLSIVLFIQTWRIGRFVINGQFDQFLLRPMNVIFQFLFQDFNLVGVSDLIPGIIIFIYGSCKIQFQFNFTNNLLLFCTLMGALLIRGGIWIICGSLSFWSKTPTQFVNLTQELFDRVTMYPLTMYPKFLQNIFTFIIPLAWISFFPTKQLLNMNSLPINLAIITLGVGITIFFISLNIMKFGLRQYESSGN